MQEKYSNSDRCFVNITGLLPLNDIGKNARSSSYVIKISLRAIDSTDGKLKATYHLDKC